MDGNQQHQSPKKDFSDPFNAGQLVGMLVMLTFIEKNNGIAEDTLNQIKNVTSTQLEDYFDKPGEDINLLISTLVESIQK